MSTMTLEEIQIEKIPSFPQTLLELLRLCHNPAVEFSAIARVIEKDPVISARVLRSAKTVFSRQWSEVTDVRRLLVVMGLENVKQIALTSAIHQFFATFSPENDRLVTSVWVRSLLCAHLAQDLARLTGYHSEAEAYTAGLLHRIGQLVLLQNFPAEYPELLAGGGDSDGGREQAERNLFKASYCEIGAALIGGLPVHSFVADAVLYQNLPQAALRDGSLLVKLLNLANRLALAAGRESGGAVELNDELLGLNVSLLAEVAGRGWQAVLAGAGAFGIDAEACLRYGGAAGRDGEIAANRQARQQLGSYVQNAALAGSSATLRSVTADRKAALKRIHQDLGVVFGLHDVGFLLYDQSRQQLTGVSVSADRRPVARGPVMLADSGSLAVRALREGRLLCSLQVSEQRPVSIIDQQLCRLYGSEGVLYLPLGGESGPIGVAVAGVSRRSWQRLEPQRELLDLFIQQLSLHFSRARRAVSDERCRQEQQREMQRLELLKQIHEANNPLAIINNYLYALSVKLGESGPVGDDLAVIKEEIARVGAILARMRDNDRPEEAAAEGTTQLNRIISGLLRLFGETLFAQQNIRASFEPDDGIPPLLLSPGAVKQVVMNLVKNAAEALPDGGTLQISTRDKIHKNGKLYVELQVADNGPGLPARVLDSLFQPVESSKEQGSGLGLAIVKNLLDRLAAEIYCSSSPAAGTRFQILLPRLTETGDQEP